MRDKTGKVASKYLVDEYETDEIVAKVGNIMQHPHLKCIRQSIPLHFRVVDTTEP